MLNSISWQSYAEMLAVTTTLYYSILFFFFRRKQGLPVRRRTNRGGITGHSNTSAPDAVSIEEHTAAGFPLSGARSLADELHALFETETIQKISKTDLLRMVAEVTQKYGGLKGTPYQKSLSSLIVFLTENRCALHLRAEDLDSVWV